MIYVSGIRGYLMYNDSIHNVSKLYRFIYETSEEDLDEIIEADNEAEARKKFYSTKDEHTIEVLIVTKYVC